MKPLLLDTRGEALIPEGYEVITGEAQWLSAALFAAQNAPCDVPALLVQGEGLCRWAATWWRERGWLCEERQSPVETLLQSCSALSREEAKAVLNDLGAAFLGLPQPLNLTDVLENLYPDFNWRQTASRSHAALWLLWLEAASLPAHHAPLIAQQAQGWRNTGNEVELLYAATAQQANVLLRNWLHLENPPIPAASEWGEFPQPLPPRWIDVAHIEYSLRATRQGVSFWDEMRHVSVPASLLEVAAFAAFSYLLHHRDECTPQLSNSLMRHLPTTDAARLRQLLPPPDPGEMPLKAVEVLAWVSERYLPFRSWQSEENDPQAGERVAQLARQFGTWFLNFYSSAMVGAGQSHLALKRAEALRGDDESAVVFWVIADGLGLADAETLLRYISSRSSRLTLHARHPAFGYVPTITSFCKQPLRWSTTPDKVADVRSNPTRREREVAGHRDATRALKEARPGDLIIWTPLDPDTTYHETADARITRAHVDGALRALAENIVDAALAVPDTLHLRIVIATDHGRLMGISTRSHRVPPGFEAHGRAAYVTDETLATPGSFSFDEAGVAVVGEVAYLDPDSFGLPVLAAVTLDNGTFMTNAGRSASRSGTEAFPHGGVYPEEVVVPWMEIARDAKTPAILVRLTGRARAGQRGTLRIEIANPNSQVFVAESLQLISSTRSAPTLSLEAPLARHDTTPITVELESWPSGAEAKSASAWLTLRRPDNRTFRVAADVFLESEELQSRDNILDDLH